MIMHLAQMGLYLQQTALVHETKTAHLSSISSFHIKLAHLVTQMVCVFNLLCLMLQMCVCGFLSPSH